MTEYIFKKCTVCFKSIPVIKMKGTTSVFHHVYFDVKRIFTKLRAEENIF